jgi:hypothetical protein
MWKIDRGPAGNDPPSLDDPQNKPNPRLQADTDDVSREDPQDVHDLDWLSLARESYYYSSSYADTNYRKKWEDGIRAFNSQHSQDSKYLSQAYSKRSNLYRPKPRAIIRKNEAAGASAFFSNIDTVDVQAENQSDSQERASADVNKVLLDYRLRKSINWFHIVQGGLQDAQKVGVCAARVYWEYEELKGRVLKDKPRVDLIPIENIRVDPASDWTDPIGTSPYIIHLMPMYVLDVKDRMNTKDPKTGRPVWKWSPDSALNNATKTITDSMSNAREKNAEDPKDGNRPIQDYSIVWIQRHIHRRDGREWKFYTLSDQSILTEPQPLEVST